MKTTLSIIIPVFNESKRLDKTIRAFGQLTLPSSLKLKEILIIDDGSTDLSRELSKKVIQSLRAHTHTPVTILSYSMNHGKGWAVRQGFRHVTGEYALIVDADMSTPLQELKKFAPLVSLKRDVIIGTRKTQEATISRPQPLYRQLFGRIYTQLANLFLQTDVSDFTCGFKVFSRSAYTLMYEHSRINRWGYDAELIFIARLHSLPIYEIPVTWNDVKGTKVSLLKDSIRSFLELFQIRCNHVIGRYSNVPLGTLNNQFTSLFQRA